MPSQLSYPGVYIEELSSGVRAITGVSTSTTAFVGWFAQGPTDRAQLITSWADFQRTFGGVHAESLASYSVRHFFDNGGSRAYIVRVVANNAEEAAVTLDTKLKISASNEGIWGNDLAVTTKRTTGARFGLTVLRKNDESELVTVESHVDLSIEEEDPRFVGRVLENRSNFIRAELVGTPTTPPTDQTEKALENGDNGSVLEPGSTAFEGAAIPVSEEGGVYLLDRIDLYNLLCIPGETKATVISKLQKFCRDRRAFLIVDAPADAVLGDFENGPDGMMGADAINSAFYFPWLVAPDPMKENTPRAFPPCGFIAGLYARTDAERGVWKAPAGTSASVVGVNRAEITLTDAENGELNPKAVNCVRNFPIFGTVVWGARTLAGSDANPNDWKYIPVRRLALFIEETLYRGTQWAVFEPNDEPLWAELRLNIGAFMQRLFRQGAFAGQTPRDAYFVKCDRETTTQNDVNLGIVNVLIGFAPLKPAEFVVLKFQQMAGQVQA